MGSTFLVSGKVTLDTGPAAAGAKQMGTEMEKLASSGIAGFEAALFARHDFGGAFWKPRFWRGLLRIRFWRRFLEGSILASVFGRLSFGESFWQARFWQGFLPGAILAGQAWPDSRRSLLEP